MSRHTTPSTAPSKVAYRESAASQQSPRSWSQSSLHTGLTGGWCGLRRRLTRPASSAAATYRAGPRRRPPVWGRAPPLLTFLHAARINHGDLPLPLSRCAERYCILVPPSPRSPLSGCLYRDVTWGTESLYPIQIQWNMAELYGGPSALGIHETYEISAS